MQCNKASPNFSLSKITSKQYLCSTYPLYSIAVITENVRFTGLEYIPVSISSQASTSFGINNSPRVYLRKYSTAEPHIYGNGTWYLNAIKLYTYYIFKKWHHKLLAYPTVKSSCNNVSMHLSC